MAVLPCNEEEIDWNVDMEVQLFHAMRGHKPVGVNRYFQMACIHEKFSNSINRELSSKQIWAHLDTMYDMAALYKTVNIAEKVEVIREVEKGLKKKAEIEKDFRIPPNMLSTYLKNKEKFLNSWTQYRGGGWKRVRGPDNPDVDESILKWFKQHESEILPFPNEQCDFDLPEIDFGELISRKLDDLPLSQSLAPKENETSPSKTSNSNGATPVLKQPKNVTPVKVNQNHSTPSANKLGKDLIGQKAFIPLTPVSTKLGKNEIVKSDAKSSRENSSASKGKPDGSPMVKVNKSISLNPTKSVKTESSNTSQKSSKHESTAENINNKKSNKQDVSNSKKQRSESSDSTSQKKIKNDGEKKPKPEVGSDMPTSGKKISKVESVNGTKKQKLDNDGVKKSVDSAGPKHAKAEGKSNPPSTPKGLKVEEDSSSSTAASSKSTKVQGKGEGGDNPNKRKRQKVDEKKQTAPGVPPFAKRRRT